MAMTQEQIEHIIEATAQRGAAITELLSCRAEIDRKLKALGHVEGAPVPPTKRGRPAGAKNRIPSDIKAALVELSGSAPMKEGAYSE